MPGAPSVTFVVFLSVLSNIGLRGSRVLVALSALHLGANAFTVGVLAALFSVFPLLLAVYAGRVSDRMGVRTPIILGSAGMALGLLLPALHDAPFTLFACPTLIGLGQIFVQVSIQNAVGSIGGASARAGNFGTFSLGASVSTFIGPSLAGFSIDALGFRSTHFVLASMSIAVVMLALLSGHRMPVRGERGGAHRDRAVLVLPAGVRQVDRPLGDADRPGALELRGGGLRRAPVDAGSGAALHRD